MPTKDECCFDEMITPSKPYSHFQIYDYTEYNFALDLSCYIHEHHCFLDFLSKLDFIISISEYFWLDAIDICLKSIIARKGIFYKYHLINIKQFCNEKTPLN